MINTVRITDDITYDVQRNVFIHKPTGFIINAETVLIMGFDEISDRMHGATNKWLGIHNYNAMKDYIRNVETIYT